MSIIFERRRRAAPRNNVLASWSKLARTKRWLSPSPLSSVRNVLFVLLTLPSIFLCIDGVFTELWQGSVIGCCEVSGHLIAGLKHIVFCFVSHLFASHCNTHSWDLIVWCPENDDQIWNEDDSKKYLCSAVMLIVWARVTRVTPILLGLGHY